MAPSPSCRSDGGPGSEYSGCRLGSDCTDCGPRCPFSPPAPAARPPPPSPSPPPPSSPAPPPPYPPGAPPPPTMPPMDSGTLFAVTSSTRCAELLPFGPRTRTSVPWDQSSPYFCTDCLPPSAAAHERWTQVVMLAASATPAFTIEWHFSSGPKTLAERFSAAVSVGEAVNWTVSTPTASHRLTGVWRWSTTSGTGDKLSGAATAPGTPAYLSNDDGKYTGRVHAPARSLHTSSACQPATAQPTHYRTLPYY